MALSSQSDELRSEDRPPLSTTPEDSSSTDDWIVEELAPSPNEAENESGTGGLRGVVQALFQSSDDANEPGTDELGSATPNGGQPGEVPLTFELPGVDLRGHVLPVRQGDLTRLLVAEPELNEQERKQLGAFGKILGATFHSELYHHLLELKELYAPLDPDDEHVDLESHSKEVTASSDESFLSSLEHVLLRANYKVLDLDLIEQAISAPNEQGLTYVPDFTLFEHLKVWVRGSTLITRNCRNVKTRFRKRAVQLAAYQRMVIALKFKPGLDLGSNVRSDVLYLRMFKDVPHVDMEMHLPEQGTKVRMRLIDKSQIASPIVMGIPTLAMKFLAAATLSWWTLFGLMIPPVSAGVNSFFGFHRAKHKHLSAMIHRLYYLTLANNSSVLTRLIDSAEDEEYKETILAYYFLWRAIGDPNPLSEPALDQQIEDFLVAKTGLGLNFEVDDALRKLFDLKLACRDRSGGIHAVPIDQALATLDRRWDDTFNHD